MLRPVSFLFETEEFSAEEGWIVWEAHQTQPTGQSPSGKVLKQKKEMIEAASAGSRGQVSGPAGAAAKLGVPPTTPESQIRSVKIKKHRFKRA